MKTFSQQTSLKPLPLPTLDETLDKYIESANVFLDEKQRSDTKRVVEKFRVSELAKHLQNALLHRSITFPNWLEEWWYDAYTEVRSPLYYLSLASVNQHYPPAPGTQLFRAASFIHNAVKLWMSIRIEELPVTKSRGVVWDMHQYYVLFNSVRLPQIPKDAMQRFFRTVNEGDCPSHVVVLCRGNIWKLETVEEGNVLCEDAILRQLMFIERYSQPCDYCVASLTTESRDSWANLRLKLLSISEQNALNLAIIEESVFCLTLTDETFADFDQVVKYGLLGCSKSQWSDKSLNFHFHKDGRSSAQADHSNVDAIAVLHIGDKASADSKKDAWQPKNVAFPTPKQLHFIVDDSLRAAIQAADDSFQKASFTVAVKSEHFDLFGNERLKAANLYADTVVQMALQLAFYKTHRRLAPAYETASTRAFFHGRTETVRACTEPLAKLVRLIVDDRVPLQENSLRLLFMAAYEKHNRLMLEAVNGKGCDRHLYGLRKVHQLFTRGCSPKIGIPEIFTDPAWALSGGDGNFLLSTSFIGYDVDGSYGFVCPMCEDGYGVFYKIGGKRLVIAISAFTTSRTSDLNLFGRNIKWALELFSHWFPSASKL